MVVISGRIHEPSIFLIRDFLITLIDLVEGNTILTLCN